MAGSKLNLEIGADEIELTATAATLIEESILPFVTPVALSVREVLDAVKRARSIRGGAIYDFLHLTAARKAHVDRLYTLNLRHFRAFQRPDDPEVVYP